jgi:hypothetical protein
MATKSSKKSAPKMALVDAPTVKSSKEGSITVGVNSVGNAYTLSMKMLVGAPTLKKTRKGKKYTISGEFLIDGPVDIGGVEHWISVFSGWEDGKKVNKISVRPSKTAGPDDDDDDDNGDDGVPF